MTGTDVDTGAEVLVVTGFTQNPGKFERHIGPLLDVVDHGTVVSRIRYDEHPGATYAYVPDVGNKYLELVLQFVYALYYGFRYEYDLVVTFSVIPYGLFGLCVGALTRTPTHLGAIGGDIDVHARSWYRQFTVAAFERFDVISVPGAEYRRRFRELGIPSERVKILVNPIDTSVYHPPSTESASTEYDFIWVGRFSEEKNPLLFVRALDALSECTPEFNAVMLGSGELEEDVRSALRECGLNDRVDLPGWVDSPVEYYRRSRIFVLTSSRDALPLTLVEAMSTGLPSVAPRVGSVPDVIDDGENGVLLSPMDADSLADELRSLASDPSAYRRLSDAAEEISSEYSYSRASENWATILETVRESSPTDGAQRSDRPGKR